MNDFAQWVPCRLCGLPVGLPRQAHDDCLIQAIEQLRERNQQAAQALDTLATTIGYPVNSIHAMREQVREVARVVRGGEARDEA